MAEVASIATPTKKGPLSNIRLFADAVITEAINITGRKNVKAPRYTDESFNPTIANKLKRDMDFIASTLTDKAIKDPRRKDLARMAASYHASLIHGASLPTPSSKKDFNKVAQNIADIRTYEPMSYQILTSPVSDFNRRVSPELLKEIDRRTPGVVKLREKFPHQKALGLQLIDRARRIDSNEQSQAAKVRNKLVNEIYQFQRRVKHNKEFIKAGVEGSAPPIYNKYEMFKEGKSPLPVNELAPIGISSVRIKYNYDTIETCERIIKQNVEDKKLRDDLKVEYLPILPGDSPRYHLDKYDFVINKVKEQFDKDSNQLQVGKNG